MPKSLRASSNSRNSSRFLRKKRIFKLSRDFFIEQQRFSQRRLQFSNYYSRPRYHDNALRARNLMQSLQSLLSFSQSLIKTRFVPINPARFCANFKKNCDFRAVKARIREKISLFCSNPRFFQENFLLALLYRKLAVKLAEPSLAGIFAYLLRNSLQPARIRENLERLLEKMLRNSAANQLFFEKFLQDFNFAPEFLDADLCGNVRFSTKSAENRSERCLFAQCEWLSFNKKLSFRTILGTLLKMLRFFYVFRYIFQQIFENCGKTLRFRVSFQLQYDKSLIKPAVFREISREFALSQDFSLELSFSRPEALNWSTSARFSQENLKKKLKKSQKNCLKADKPSIKPIKVNKN